MLQAPVLNGALFDPFSLFEDFVASAEVDISGCEIAEAFVVPAMIVVLDECLDLGFKVFFEEVVFKQDAVFERLMPALDFALRLWVSRRAVTLFHAPVFQPI